MNTAQPVVQLPAEGSSLDLPQTVSSRCAGLHILIQPLDNDTDGQKLT